MRRRKEHQVSKRSIIVHFHFFKNAGTSVESILRRHFGRRFASHEHGGPAETFPATVLVPFLQKNRKVQALSSHTICFPPPTHPDWSVYPIVFLRHPLDRILSMYNFEKNQDSQSPGAIIAREHGPAGYITERMKNPGERTLRNYQAWMLAQHTASSQDDNAIFQAAVEAVESLPVTGVVDEFAESVEQMTGWLSPHFPGLTMTPEHQNRTAPAGLGMDERISRLKKTVGDDLFRYVEHENEADIELYNRARRRLLENTV